MYETRMIGTFIKGLAVAASKPSSSFLGHIGWNLLGQAAPLLAALVSIPILIKGIGIDRFGILTIAWMLIGYFSLFDLGIGRAMTQLICEKLVKEEHEALPQLIWTGLITMFGLGTLATVIIVALSNWAIYRGLNIPANLQKEAMYSLYMLAPAVPLVVVSTGLRGILEARQQFKATNLVRIPLGVLMFAGPLCVLPWTSSLVAIFGVLLLVRLSTLIALAVMCWRSLDHFRQFKFSKEVLPDMLKFGGWMTVSNVVSPIMVQMDRFVIGGILSMAAVAYYATPFEMVTKILLIPTAIAGVAFPTFARLIAKQDMQEAKKLYWRSIKLVALVMLPFVLILDLFADDILRIWLHGAFPDDSAMVLRILAVGVLMNGLAHIPFAFLHGAKRANITAKIHLGEVPVYLFALILVVPRFGIVGTAAIWTLRVGIDGILMHFFSNTLRKSSSSLDKEIPKEI